MPALLGFSPRIGNLFLPYPGGYGTETHGHLGLSHGNGHVAPAPVAPAAVAEPAPG